MGARAPRRDAPGPRRAEGPAVGLAAARSRPRWAEAVATAVTQIEDEIANLRSLITELRPAALDELGLGAAIEGLADNHAAATGMDTKASLALAREGGIAPRTPRPRARVERLPARPGGAHERRQARGGGDRLDRSHAGQDLDLDRRPRRRCRLRHGRPPSGPRPGRHARARRARRRQPHDRLDPRRRHRPPRPNPPRAPMRGLRREDRREDTHQTLDPPKGV